MKLFFFSGGFKTSKITVCVSVINSFGFHFSCLHCTFVFPEVDELFLLPFPHSAFVFFQALISVDPEREEHGMPELFLNMERIRFRSWHMPNTKMKIPKGYTFLKIQHCGLLDVKASCLNNLFAFVIRDCLSEVRLGHYFTKIK